ncbi:hypothetical protein [Eremococcus coleocola]|uniref:hypothetical protein n=1 Tax=Eremococcus coleocola TaxID=88132 RepID=UPI0004263046|nr:hypothetical protein [Eremococcus coleocola]
MKKVINGKRYNTDKAMLMASARVADRQEDLYKKRTGEFFLHSIADTEELQPLTFKQAEDWAWQNLLEEDYNKIFGVDESNNYSVQTTIAIKKSILDKLKLEVARTGELTYEIIEKALEAYLK